MYNCFGNCFANTNFAPTNILRGGAVVARWAHNPKVGGSNPPSATIEDPSSELMGSPFFMSFLSIENERFTEKRVLTFEVR